MSNLRSYIKDNFNPKRPSTAVVSIKNNKMGMLDELKNETRFLLDYYDEITVNQMMYHYINNVSKVLTCSNCGSPRKAKKYNARITGDFYQVTCGKSECRNKIGHINSKKGIKEKYGVDNISQTEYWREKVKATNLEKRGVEWNTQTSDLIEKAVFSLKSRSKELHNKRRETCTKKYGEAHHMKNSEIFSKSKSTAFSSKEYKMPSGKIVKVQGYEDKALDILLDKYDESDLIVKDSDIEKAIGKIEYLDNDKIRRYYPDIYIISENRIVEVKSDYTFNKEFNINILKRQACINMGLNFDFMIL